MITTRHFSPEAAARRPEDVTSIFQQKQYLNFQIETLMFKSNRLFANIYQRIKYFHTESCDIFAKFKACKVTTLLY